MQRTRKWHHTVDKDTGSSGVTTGGDQGVISPLGFFVLIYYLHEISPLSKNLSRPLTGRPRE